MSSDDPNVTYSPGADSPEVARRLYRVIFVANLGADAGQGLSPIDKEGFADALARAKPSVALAIPNPAGSGGEWEFKLTFDSLKSFEPAGFLKQVPQAGWRMGVREKLLARRAGEISPQELERVLTEAAQADTTLGWLTTAMQAGDASAASPAPPPDAGGASILDMVDAPDGSSRVASDVERLAADAGDAAKRVSGAEGGRLNTALARVDRELGAVCEAILKHDDYRRVESAWRGLRFMVDRIDFREGVRLWALHATRADAADRFIEHVVNPAFDGDIDTPGLVIFDYPFTNSAGDVEMLDLLAQHAASLPVPIITPIDAAFFDIKNLRLIKNLPNFSGLIDGWQFAKWRTLRDQPYAKSLAPIVGRFILRAPYQAKSNAREYTHTEQVSKVSDLLWAYGHLPMGVSAARSFVKNGWPTRMYGAEAGKVEDLPVVDNPTDPQTPWGPGDLFLPDRRVDELPQIGMNALMAVKNQDYCMLLGGVSAARPIKTADNSSQQAALEISLPYQQFANIASTYVCEQIPSLRGLAEAQIQERLIAGFADLMKITTEDDQEAVQVGVGKHPENPEQTIVQIRLEPPGRIVPGGLHIEFGFAV